MSDIRGLLTPGLMSERSRTNTPQGLLSIPSSGIEPGLLGIANDVFARYGLLDKHRNDYALIGGKPMADGTGYLESYPPQESFNPIPGKATTELYSGSGTPEEQRQLVSGDFLHHVGQADPQWKAMKSDVLGTLTPEQLNMAQQNFAFYKSRGDPRTLEQFVDQSFGDEFLMGYLTPDRNNEWRNVYTPEQRKKLGQMADYLIRGSTAPGYR